MAKSMTFMDTPPVPPSLQSSAEKSITRNSLIKHFYPNSSLIRRARLIRRRTTNQYCQTLKRLAEEDAVVISQILIIRLKPRSETTEYECNCVGNSSPTEMPVIPSVDFAYPPLGTNAKSFPPPLFYPDFMKGTVQRKEDREAFLVILTNEKGDRTFAYCFKFLNAQISAEKQTIFGSLPPSFSVLVFASPYPHELLFHKFATDFVSTLNRDGARMFTMCKDLLKLRITTSENLHERSKYVLSSDNLRWTRSSVSTTVEKVGVENAVIIFLSLMAERRLIITGTNVTDVSRTVQAFVRLLSPLDWPHTLIPIIPDSQIELCFNPTPYICGLLRYNLDRINELICPRPGDLNDDIILFDVERGFIIPILGFKGLKQVGLKILLNYTSSMGFPRSAVCDLLSALRSCMPVRDPAKTDYRIEKKVMIWYAKIFGHFPKFDNILTARNRKRFAQAHPCTDTRLFLKWFVENGILQQFIFSQNDEKYRNTPRIRFQKILKKYAPPVTKQGKRRKAKSLVWKIFTL